MNGITEPQKTIEANLLNKAMRITMKRIANVDHSRVCPDRNPDTYERCVLCGRKTNVPFDLPIENRANYVEGVGQLCWACWQNLYAGDQTCGLAYLATIPPNKKRGGMFKKLFHAADTPLA